MAGEKWCGATLLSCTHEQGCYASRNPFPGNFPHRDDWPVAGEYQALKQAKEEYDRLGPGGTWNMRDGDAPLPKLKAIYRAVPVKGVKHMGGLVTALVRKTRSGYRSGVYCQYCQLHNHCGFFKQWDGFPVIFTGYQQTVIAAGARITVNR